MSKATSKQAVALSLPMVACLACILLPGAALGADLNVLVIGSSVDGGTIFNGRSWQRTKPIQALEISNQLEKILSGAGLGSVTVTFKDRFQTVKAPDKSSAVCYNLVTWFYFPYPEGVEATRWADLRGEGGTAWDYVILIGDAHTMEYTPGMYTLGVARIAEEVAKGKAELVLLMPWPVAGSKASVDHYKEVTYRTGRSGGFKVAPAGLAWQAARSTKLTTGGSPAGAAHRNADGAYIAAASIYSRIWNKSAKHSSYTYNDALADTVHKTVAANVGKQQYTGRFTFQSPYLMLNDKRRHVRFDAKGTSTEGRFGTGAGRALKRSRVLNQSQGNPKAWNHGRYGNYKIDPAKWQLAYGFVYQPKTSFSLPIANNLIIGYMTGHDNLLANRILRQGPSARNVPVRTLFAQLHQADPKLYPKADYNLRDTHNSDLLNEAVGTYMYALYSGRCPLDTKPASPDIAWTARKIGYETAWRLGRCQTRAPGFKVMPSAAAALTITPETVDTMTVQFIMQPRSNVSVVVTSSDTSAGIAGPHRLLFTPTNYNIPQTVTLTGACGTATSAPFSVQFNTKSDDEVYNGLHDAWTYTCKRPATAVTHVDKGATPHSTFKNTLAPVALGVEAASKANTVFVGPNRGALSWDGANIVYTPAPDFVGVDGFSFRCLVGDAHTTGTVTLHVSDKYPAGSVRAEVTDGTATEEGRTTGAVTITRTGKTASPLAVNFALSGTAKAGADYTLSATSPVTIPRGKDSVVITLTPVDDTVSGERKELATLTIAKGTGYAAVNPTATIVIEDNDNHAPVVKAGPDQSVSVQKDNVAWTPAHLAPVGWYDASDTSTITRIGGGVSQWADNSGNGHHLSQGMPAERPPLADAAINGLPAIDFDGSYHTLRTSGNPFGATLRDAFVILVHRHDRNMWGHLFSLSGPDMKGKRWQTRAPDGKGKVSFRCDGKGGTISSPYGVEKGQSVLTSFYCSTTENVQQVHKSGALLVEDATGHAVNTAGGIVVGGNGGLMWQHYQDSAVGEFIIINGTVSTKERQKLEGYLAHKWGLAGSLPEDHPYKNAAPMGSVATVTLDGTASDADGEKLATAWSKISGPGPVFFSRAAVADTAAFFSKAGTYVLRLTADDGIDQSLDETTITVTAADGVALNPGVKTGP